GPSQNGTFVNNKRVVGLTPLKDGDRIMICDFLCSFHLHAPPPAAPSPTPPGAGSQLTTAAQTKPVQPEPAGGTHRIIHFKCPWCEEEHSAEDRLAGRTLSCRKCRKDLQVPASQLPFAPHPTPPGAGSQPTAVPQTNLAKASILATLSDFFRRRPPQNRP